MNTKTSFSVCVQWKNELMLIRAEFVLGSGSDKAPSGFTHHGFSEKTP